MEKDNRVIIYMKVTVNPYNRIEIANNERVEKGLVLSLTLNIFSPDLKLLSARIEVSLENDKRMRILMK